MAYKLTLEEEKSEILKRYRRLLRYAKPVMKDGDMKVIRKAFDTAVEAHKDMRRKSGEPYIFHPIEVAQIAVEEIGLGTTSLVAALLHDVVEDTDTTLEDIEKAFGRKVAKIIDGLTKISGGFDVGSSPQAENFRKMLLTLTDDVRVILVKLADRLHNMRTLGSMPRHKQLKIASETIYIYAPLAHRLGLYSIKSELEDLYLKYTEPDTYYFIANKISETKNARSKFIREFISPIQNELKKAYIDFTIKGRPKSIFSIWNKMKKQNIPFEEIYDLFAVRVIINCPPEKEKTLCWQIYSVVTDNYRPNPSRLRDWISNPKTNGYESLHTTVMSSTGKWVEVQVRSKRMDEIAEKGYAAHWKYKENDKTDGKISSLDNWIGSVRDILSYENTSALEFIDDFKSNLYHKEIFVFTPKGDLKILPNGATALDFAFEVHTDVGLHCKAAKINHKLVSLSHVLKNGDQVEVISHPSQSPSDDWKKIVKTTKAKRVLKEYFNGAERAVEAHGKDMFQKFLKKNKVKTISSFLDTAKQKYSYSSTRKFYNDLGRRNFMVGELKSLLNPMEGSEAAPTSVKKKESTFQDDEDRIKKINKTELVIGSGVSDIKYSFAKCCNPIPGENVFGFVTINDGVKIHKISCKNATELMSSYGYRVIKAKWESDIQKKFLVKIKVRGTDRLGFMNDITNVISSIYGINIKRIRADSYDEIIEDEFHLEINNVSLVETLFEALIKIEGVMSVERLVE